MVWLVPTLLTAPEGDRGTEAGGPTAGRPATILATWFALGSVNQRFPSCPAAMLISWLLALGTAYSVKAPAVVTLATLFALYSVNQRLPSGPAAMPDGLLLAVGMGYSVKAPPVVTLATLFPLSSVNPRFPS